MRNGKLARPYGLRTIDSPGEDCLVLNVLTPAIVWLHGNGFASIQVDNA